VFWNRAAREARRQKVLEDLIDLTPEERLLRMDRAVADGDVRADEVDQAIRLVGRIDALRVMTIPGPRSAAPLEGSNVNVPPEPRELASVKAARKPSRRARRRAAIAVTPELIEASKRAIVAPMRRSSARDAAVRKANRSIGGAPRRRRLRFAASLPAPTPATAGISAQEAASAEAPDLQFAMAAVSETKQEEQWPNIAWLRP